MSQNYQPYGEYKDSGVEWLGEIPGHWELRPLKYLCQFSGGGTPSKEKPEYWNGEIPWVSPKDMKVAFISDTQDKITREAISESSTSMVPTGAVLIVVRSGILQHSIPVAINTVPVTLNQDMKALRFGDSSWANFFAYFTKGLQKQLLLEWGKQGATVESIEQEFLANTPVPVPGLHERQQIAAFLDHETARIDQLIAKQQRLIELLKEKRQAVISHAVTKGLNPNAPMKDSGVEWLGDVPEHWEVKRLKLVADLQSGIAKGKELADVETVSVPMLRVANVQDGYVDLRDVQNIEIEAHSLKRYRLRSGDVLMNEGGDSDKLGRGAVWYGQIEPCIHQNHVFAIRPHHVEPEWIQRVTESPYARFHFYRVAKQSTNLASISSSNIRETPLLVPPQLERKQIMAFIDHETARIDQLITKQQSMIGLAKERRTALISATVTGKIDLRDWQAPVDSTPGGRAARAPGTLDSVTSG